MYRHQRLIRRAWQQVRDDRRNPHSGVRRAGIFRGIQFGDVGSVRLLASQNRLGNFGCADVFDDLLVDLPASIRAARVLRILFVVGGNDDHLDGAGDRGKISSSHAKCGQSRKLKILSNLVKLMEKISVCLFAIRLLHSALISPRLINNHRGIHEDSRVSRQGIAPPF